MTDGISWISTTTGDELVLLVVAFVLCAVIGVERQLSRKSAGLRTLILVGVGSAGFTLVSAYGFARGSASGATVDPSRIAAQVVSGIGFLGAGVIFLRRSVVKGLTTAATIWLTAAVGMACGAGQVVLATTLTGLHVLTVTVVAPLAQRLHAASDRRTVTVRYDDGKGTLRDILAMATEMGYQTTVRSTKQVTVGDTQYQIVAVMQFRGRPALQTLVTELTELTGVQAVTTTTHDEEME